MILLFFLYSVNICNMARASDNSRVKKWNFAGFEETNSQRKRASSREFRGNFRGKFSPKSKQESTNERFLKKYRKDVKFRAKKKHKSSSNTLLKATVLVSSDKKKNDIQLYGRNSWPLLSAAISSRKQQRNKFLSSHRSFVLLCSLQGKIVRDGRFKSICEVKTFWCLRSCPARTIKHVPALLQTAVSFHIPYSVNEKSFIVPRLSQH